MYDNICIYAAQWNVVYISCVLWYLCSALALMMINAYNDVASDKMILLRQTDKKSGNLDRKITTQSQQIQSQ